MSKFALVSFGNEESYGLLYAAEEFKKHGDIKFFDAEFNECVDSIIEYKPDYLCFSPMTTFYHQAKEIEQSVKKQIETTSIFGGHHATNCGYDCGDITVVGAVHGLDISKRGRLFNGITKSENLKTPARSEYFRDIPRFKDRYRKIMLSVTGCPFVCTYCSSSSNITRKVFGNTRCHLQHRCIDDIIEEAKFIKNTTHEIEWVDDDIFYGDHEWLKSFLTRWQKEIKLPMYVSTTSISALKTKPDVLRLLRNSVNCIGLGVQAINQKSLSLLGRKWDNEQQMKDAYDYLSYFGFRVNLQAIVGLPIQDPIGDALETIEGLKRIGTGSIVSVYPLQIYPNTQMEKYCNDNLYKFNQFCKGDTNSGLPSIDFGDRINNQIRNICKLATMVVKYGISQEWLESMLDLELGNSSKQMSITRYYECIKDRLPEKADKIFNNIVGTMKVRY